MTDLLADLNVNVLGLKPFPLNVFKTGMIMLWIVLAVAMIASKSWAERLKRRLADLDRMSAAQHRLMAWSVGLLFTTVLIHLRVKQYFELQTMWDMATETNMAWHMVHGPWFFNSLDNRSLLGQHFSPIMLVIGLAYRLIEHPLTLLTIQSVAFGLGAVAVYELALLRCERKGLALLVVALYMLNPYLHNSGAHDFHRSSLAIPAILWLLVFVESGRRGAAAACVLLACLIEESLPLPLAALGLYLAAFRRGWRVFGAALAFVAVSYFLVVVKVLLPAFTPEQGLFFWERYANLGQNLGDALENIARHPFWAMTEALVRHNQYVRLMYFLAPVMFLPLLAWREACLLVVPIAIMFFSQNPGQYKLAEHYSAPALPFLFYSVVWGLVNGYRYLERWAASSPERWNKAFALALCLLAVNTYRCPGYDLGKTDPQFTSAVFAMADLIPGDAGVASDVRFAPLLANRHRICKVNLIPGTLCDWIPVGVGALPNAVELSERMDPDWIPEYVLVGVEIASAPPFEVERQRRFVQWLVADLGYREVRSLHGASLLQVRSEVSRE